MACMHLPMHSPSPLLPGSQNSALEPLPLSSTSSSSFSSFSSPHPSTCPGVLLSTAAAPDHAAIHLRTSIPSPLSIPEILQEICLYLDRTALVNAGRVSKQFWACTAPLLWTTIPESAWENDFFQANWHRHADQIHTLCCGPGTSLENINLYCHNLVSLDASRIREPVRTGAQGSVSKRITFGGDGSVSQLKAMENSRNACIRKSTLSTRDSSPESYNTFVKMADDLVRVIQANENLRSLQLRPQGRIPSRLLDALSKLEHLEALSLDAWQDFQEYSLQLIMDACPGLARLSLGQNDFTRFTLETLQGSDRRPTLRLRASGSPEVDKTDARLGLERFDDPIKGRSTAFDSSTQFPLEMHSKRAVLYTSAVIPAHPTVPITTHQQQTFNQFKKRCPSVAPQNQIRTLSLHHSGLRQEFLVNLAQQCPQLEHLSLLDGWGFYPSTRFASILSQACPHLSRIEFREQTLDLQDEFFVSLCQHIPRLQWIHAGRTGFSQGALNAVRMRCSNMVSLNLDGARGIQSQALNQLLETCESLKVLSAQGVVLNGRDVSDGSNWVCRELETLVLDIEIYAVVEPVGPSATLSLSKSPDSVVTVRKRVYDQVARLTRLRMLGLGGGHRVGSAQEVGVDLTLKSGLEALRTLHCLERLDLRRMLRSQSKEDLEWMVQHWPRLWSLDATKSRVTHYGAGGSGGGAQDTLNKAIDWLTHARPGMGICLH